MKVRLNNKEAIAAKAREREEKRGRPPVSEYRLEDIKCEKCNLYFESKKAKKKHISQEHRI